MRDKSTILHNKIKQLKMLNWAFAIFIICFIYVASLWPVAQLSSNEKANLYENETLFVLFILSMVWIGILFPYAIYIIYESFMYVALNKFIKKNEPFRSLLTRWVDVKLNDSDMKIINKYFMANQDDFTFDQYIRTNQYLNIKNWKLKLAIRLIYNLQIIILFLFFAIASRYMTTKAPNSRFNTIFVVLIGIFIVLIVLSYSFKIINIYIYCAQFHNEKIKTSTNIFVAFCKRFPFTFWKDKFWFAFEDEKFDSPK
ncbi:hypothetical protein [Mycoplasmopsis verecunda]|uniref:Uncharacterized protein n=1 Tax=Mycoplasmopsis verecunda TaxID=171291 RepID=A0A1T4LZP2_9BACT|nr:hypothetical protein [Mycoplasmopsis verecunda]WPB54472.1 hypothetical protein SAM46_03235 [Mycoplasmopsis verecunda]SJZ59934.1 hypothetical protein SAMN02745154_00580 [Mycoplasmopsis verecunda]